jgi:hypothetical protein
MEKKTREQSWVRCSPGFGLVGRIAMIERTLHRRETTSGLITYTLDLVDTTSLRSPAMTLLHCRL